MDFSTIAAWVTTPFQNLPAWNWALQIIGLLTAYIGAELNSRGKASGFAVWIISNVALGVIHAVSQLWLLFVLDFLFLRINILGLRNWKKSPPLPGLPATGIPPQS